MKPQYKLVVGHIYVFKICSCLLETVRIINQINRIKSIVSDLTFHALNNTIENILINYLGRQMCIISRQMGINAFDLR